MVYFVRNTHDGSIKIGYSANPEARLRQLQTSSAHRLELIGSIPGEMDAESLLHGLLPMHRLEGEWFRPDAQVVGLINLLLAVSASAPPAPAASGLPDFGAIVVWQVEGDVLRGPGISTETLFVVNDDISSPPNPNLAMDISDPAKGWITVESVRQVANWSYSNGHSPSPAVQLIDGVRMDQATVNALVGAALSIECAEKSLRHHLEQSGRDAAPVDRDDDEDGFTIPAGVAGGGRFLTAAGDLVGVNDEVGHPQYGLGVIVAIEGGGPNVKGRVRFKVIEHGERTFILARAPLKRLNP